MKFKQKKKWLPGPCVSKICGEEAACLPGRKFTHKCVCPSDLSAPVTKQMLCPNRKTVPLTPRPIFNISVGGEKTAKNSTPVFRGVDNRSPDTTHPSVSLILFGIWGFILLCAAILCIAYWLYKKRSHSTIRTRTIQIKTEERELSDPASPTKEEPGVFMPNPEYFTDDSTPAAVLSKDSLIFKEQIGRGFYGTVYKGELIREDGSKQIVAVKVLKSTAIEQHENFMREVETMCSFRHENILTLIGIVQKDRFSIPWMVFEYMIFGDLAEVLRNNSKPLWKPVPGLKPLDQRDLISIALQISAGMEYLASQRFVHNDLACRNCLVDYGLVVKIADFGLSRDVYTCDYYRMGNSKPVPLRWMAPESIMYGKYTLESDVWSYGVVLWEIYTYGKQPYFGQTNEQVLHMIVQGNLLSPPRNCPNNIKTLMKACWVRQPKERLRFYDIHAILQTILDDEKFDAEMTITRKSPHHIEICFSNEKSELSSDSPTSPDSFASCDFLAASKQTDILSHPEYQFEPESNVSVQIDIPEGIEIADLPLPPDFPVPPATNMIVDAEDYLRPRKDRMHNYILTLPEEPPVREYLI